jgi:pilus assembly protein FimV
MASDRSRILKSAEKYVASGKSAQAIDEYLKILKENPKEWNVMIQVGDLYLKINKPADAVDHFQTVADHYYSDGFFLKAIAIYKRINKLDPSLTDICMKLADLYLKQGLTMDAKSQLQIVAQSYLSKNQNKEAIATLKKLIEIEPDNLKTRNDLAKAFKSEGMIPEAVKEYLEISEELLRKSLFKESLAVLETANKLDPKEPSILRSILQVYTSQKETGKAAALLEDALRMDPSNAEILALVAESHAESGDFAKAHELIDRAILNTSKKDHLWRIKGDFYLKSNELPRAFSQYSQVIEKMVQRKEIDDAISLLQKITKAEPNFYPAWLRVVELYSILRQPANIINSLGSLVDAYISKGLYQEAARHARKLVGLEPEDSQHQEKLDFIRSFIEKTKTDIQVSPEEEPPEEEAEIATPKPPPKVAAKSVPHVTPPPEALSTPVASTHPHEPAASSAAPPTEEDKEFVSEHLIEAEVFNKYGLIDKAIEQVQMVISRAPNSVQAHQKLKEIYLEKGERDKAVEQCVAMSRIFRKNGDIDQAEDILSEARQINPNHTLLERAYKEMPAPQKSADVLGEIEKLAQSIKNKSGPIKLPGHHPGRKDLPSTQSILSQLFPSTTKQPAPPAKSSPSLKLPRQATAPKHEPLLPPPRQPEPPVMEEIEVDIVEAEMESTPESLLSADVFEEIDFYVGQGMQSDAERLLLELKEKHPNDAGVLDRLKSLETGQPIPKRQTKSEEPAPVAEDEIMINLDDFDMPAISNEPAAVEKQASQEAEEFDLDLEGMDASESISFVESEQQQSASDKPTDPIMQMEQIEKNRVTPIEQTWDLSGLSKVAKAAEETELPEGADFDVDIEQLGPVGEEAEEPLVSESGAEPVPELQEAGPTEFPELEEGTPEESEEGEAEQIPGVPQTEDARLFGDAVDAVFAKQKTESEPEPEVTVSVKAPEELFEEEDQFFDLAAELEEGFLNVQSAVEEERPPDGQNYSLEQILTDFRKGVDKQVSAEDYDTRYNLGIAYKEMGLIDEAIAEFQIASKDPKRFLECCSMLGLCFIEKGMQKLAIKWYKRGLQMQGYSEDEYQGLRFDLAQAYENMGERKKALEVYQEVYGVNAGYRNVSKKIKDLQDQTKKS